MFTKLILQRIQFNQIFKPIYRFTQATLPSFKPYMLNPKLMTALEANKIETPSSIQDMAIPILIRDTSQTMLYYIASQTGAGKTLAYLLPIFHKLKLQEEQTGGPLTISKRPRCIILASSKELCMQIEVEAKKLAHLAKLKVLSCHNLKPFKREKESLINGVDIVVSTLERLQKHREKDNLYFSNVCYFVVEEADTQFEMGFGEVIQKYVDSVFKRGQMREETGGYLPNIFFISATFTGQLNRYFQTIDEKRIRKIIDKKTHLNLENLKHEFVHCITYDKIQPSLQLINQFLSQIDGIEDKNEGGILIFCNSIPSLHSLEHVLNENGIQCVSLHSDVPRKVRLQNYTRFKNQDCKIMLATDVGSRGLDFPFLTHVLNYDFPKSTSDYLHRAGRAGRAGKVGYVYSLYRNNDMNLINQLQSSQLSQKPLTISGSQYQMINREILERMKKDDDSGGKQYEQQKKQMKYIPKEFGGLGTRQLSRSAQLYQQSQPIPHITKQQKMMLKGYKPQVDKYTKTFHKLKKQVRKMKKWERVKQMNKVRSMKLQIKTNQKKSYQHKKYQMRMNRRRNKSISQQINV